MLARSLRDLARKVCAVVRWILVVFKLVFDPALAGDLSPISAAALLAADHHVSRALASALWGSAHYLYFLGLAHWREGLVEVSWVFLACCLVSAWQLAVANWNWRRVFREIVRRKAQDEDFAATLANMDVWELLSTYRSEVLAGCGIKAAAVTIGVVAGHFGNPWASVVEALLPTTHLACAAIKHFTRHHALPHTPHKSTHDNSIHPPRDSPTRHTNTTTRTTMAPRHEGPQLSEEAL